MGDRQRRAGLALGPRKQDDFQAGLGLGRRWLVGLQRGGALFQERRQQRQEMFGAGLELERRRLEAYHGVQAL